MTLHIEPYDTREAAVWDAALIRRLPGRTILGIIEHESSAGVDFRQYILVYLA